MINKIIEFSTSEDGNFYDITTRLCYLQDFNMNGIKLIGESADENVMTLKDTPVVAYLDWRWGEKDDFGGHEAWVDSDGELRFDTSSVGHTTEVWVKDEMVKPVYSSEEKMLPVVYCKSRIYASRFPEYSKVIKRLISEESLGVSWELEPKKISMEESEIEGIPNPRSTDSYEFIGYAMLGSTVVPAYGENAKVLEISEGQKEEINKINDELSSALKLDLANAKDKANENLEQERGNEMEKIQELEALVAEKDSKIEELEAKVSELATTVAEVEAQEKAEEAKSIEDLEAKLVEASEKLEALTSQVEELKPYKEKFEAIEAEKAEVEKAEKIKELKAMATRGGYITEEELESDEAIAKMISECDEAGIKLLKAERIIASSDAEKIETSSKEEETEEKLELSEETKAGEDFASAFGIN